MANPKMDSREVMMEASTEPESLSKTSDSLPLPRIPNTEKQEKASKLIGFAFLVHLGLLTLAGMLVLFLISYFLSIAWLFLLNDIYNVKTISKTFAWEQIIQLLGSFYDDCLDYSGPTPVQTVPSKLCMHSWSLPWIPVVFCVICLFMLVVSTFLAIWMYFKDSSPLPLIKFLIGLCAAESILFTIAMIRIYYLSNSYDINDFLRKHMLFTMNVNVPHLPVNIYQRWNITQSAHKCCGVDGPGDWKFDIFRNGDQRHPKSCCNTDDFICHHYPKRNLVWAKGCLETEVEIVESYKNWEIFLLILTHLTMLLITALFYQLYIFFERSQFQMPGRKIQVTFFGWNLFTIDLNEKKWKWFPFCLKNSDTDSPAKRYVLQPMQKYESNGKCCLAINGSGIFFSSELTRATLLKERTLETWV